MSSRTFTEIYAIPGQHSIIDTINPATGLTSVYGHTEAEVLEREPGAVRMPWDTWRAEQISRQATPIMWTQSSETQYINMLEVLPPAAWIGGAFLVGEPVDHSFATGAPRFQAYRKRGSDPWFVRYEAATRPMTIAEFRAEVDACHPS